MAFAQVNGVRLYYELAGAGDPLLCISGTGGDLRRQPSPGAGPLGRTFEVLAYDQRGLGRSDVPEGPYSMAGYADDAAGLLESLGWSECAVLGTSFGGMVAQELAIRHPDRVNRLVLACTSPGGRERASYPLHELVDGPPERGVEAYVERMDTRWDAAWRTAHPNEVALYTEGLARMWADGDAARGLRLQLEARRHHDTGDRLSRIGCPTLVCGGRYDGIAPPANSAFLADSIPDAKLAMFEGGHLFLLQDRAAVPAITSFLLGDAVAGEGS
jgi:3-oxoadipate enol-lactonase